MEDKIKIDDNEEVTLLRTTNKTLETIAKELKGVDHYENFGAVVQSIGRLSKELQLKLSDVEKAAKTQPTAPPAPNISVKAPQVNVAPPDLSALEALLNKRLSDIVKELTDALPTPPATDLSGVEDGLHKLLLTTAEVRDRKIPVPQMPTTLKVVNPDGSNVSSAPIPLIDKAYDYVGFSNPDGNDNYQTIAFKSGGSSGTTQRTLTLAYDGSSNVTSITRS